MRDHGLVTVFKSQGMLQAQVIRGKLESVGIPVFLKYEAIGQLFGLTIDGLGLVQVQVPEALVEQAESLLTEENQADSLVSDADEGDESGFSFPGEEWPILPGGKPEE